MKMFKEVTLRFLVALLLVGSMLPIFETGKAAGDDAAIIIDHTSTDIIQIPESAIMAAKASLHIGYGHTSHGSQLTQGGMKNLVAFANNHGLGLNLPTNIFAYNNGGTGGALDLEEGSGTDEGWLAGTCGQYPPYSQPPTFVAETREYLDDPSHADVNVIMWSWCREADDEYRAGVIEENYLEPMNALEAEYPDVKFVYMTGTLNFTHENGNWAPGLDAEVDAANEIIRNYCRTNGKILYDFADIESWDPDGIYYPFADEYCNYYNSADDLTPIGNWATEWQNSHTINVYWYNCSPQHSLPLNGNLKAYAAWWLFARLADWNPDDIMAPSVTVISPNGSEKRKVGCQYNITWTATDDRGVTSVDISYSADNGASYTDIATGEANDGNYTWTIPDTASATCLVKVEASDAAGNVGQDTSNAVFEICVCMPGDANDDGCVNALDITKTERIVMGLDAPAEDADANRDSVVNILDITEIEHIISGS